MHTKKEKIILKLAHTTVIFFFVVPIIYSIFLLITQRSSAEFSSQKSVYGLMLSQSLLGLISIHIPYFLAKKFDFVIPFNVHLLFIIFLFSAIFLGEIRHFYVFVRYWDVLLHFLSGVMLSMFAFMAIFIIKKNRYPSLDLPPLLLAFFVFSFSVLVGLFWEFYEFTLDAFGDFNMQKYRHGYDFLVGRAALVDTMRDLIIDAIGALITSFSGYISLGNKKGWLAKFIKTNDILSSKTK